jgi:hypothetical protein
MSDMVQYTEIRPCDRVKGEPDTYEEKRNDENK